MSSSNHVISISPTISTTDAHVLSAVAELLLYSLYSVCTCRYCNLVLIHVKDRVTVKKMAVSAAFPLAAARPASRSRL